MMSKPTLTIGIPAYNEAANIQSLLLAILRQQTPNVTLQEILVVADGCTDSTVSEIKAVTDARIHLIEHADRRGLVAAQNTIIRQACGDFLIMFDADVRPVGDLCLASMIVPLVADARIGLGSPLVVPAPARSGFERIVATGHHLKNAIYRRIRRGDNVYMCHGRARVFSRGFYQQLTWPDEFVEDAYSYFACRAAGWRFAFIPNASVQFRSPSSWYDHLKQSLRFVHGKQHMVDAFDRRTVRSAYTLPFAIVVSAVVMSMVEDPVNTVAYIGIILLTRVLAWVHRRQDHTTFAPAVSSKHL